MVTHVLAVESSKYRQALASGNDSILAGQSCARCSSSELRLTRAKVARGLQTPGRSGSFDFLDVFLARCRLCGSRERVLPSLDFHGNRVANTAAALRRAIGSEAPPPAHRFQPFLREMARLARRRVAGFALPCITDCQDSC